MEDKKTELIGRLQQNQTRQLEITELLVVLPKGHVNTLYRNNKGYYYLTYRTGNKINNDYLGPVGKTDLGEILQKLNERSRIKKELIDLKKDEKKLNKLIKKFK